MQLFACFSFYFLYLSILWNGIRKNLRNNKSILALCTNRVTLLTIYQDLELLDANATDCFAMSQCLHLEFSCIKKLRKPMYSPIIEIGICKKYVTLLVVIVVNLDISLLFRKANGLIIKNIW